jgi:hypothetical protein
MALAQSINAIGRVSDLLKTRLSSPNTTATTTDVGRPEAAATGSGTKFNLFLYQVELDGHLRNQPLDQGQPAPLWLVLRYLLTAYDTSNDSNSTAAHDLLGEGMLALHELNFINPSTFPALADNPETLKITFNKTDSEMLSKLMQGTEDQYRVSVAFEVRPVMIAPSEPPLYSLPVKTVGPPPSEGVVVLPSLGPRIERISPDRMEAGQALTVHGQDLGNAIHEICIGSVCLPVRAARSGEVRTTLPTDVSLSPGSYAISVRQRLPNGRHMSSNCLLGHLMPTLNSAVPSGLVLAGGNVHGDLVLSGNRLGDSNDDIFVAFYQNGSVVLMLDTTVSAAQTSATVRVPSASPIPAGRYYIILRVNGQQAPNAVEVDWS